MDGIYVRLVIYLICQLISHVIGCKNRKSRSVYCSGQSFVSQIVSLVYCLSVLVSVKHTVLNKKAEIPLTLQRTLQPSCHNSITIKNSYDEKLHNTDQEMKL